MKDPEVEMNKQRKKEKRKDRIGISLIMNKQRKKEKRKDRIGISLMLTGCFGFVFWRVSQAYGIGTGAVTIAIISCMVIGFWILLAGNSIY